jgi:hypothetical protein
MKTIWTLTKLAAYGYVAYAGVNTLMTSKGSKKQMIVGGVLLLVGANSLMQSFKELNSTRMLVIENKTEQ